MATLVSYLDDLTLLEFGADVHAAVASAREKTAANSPPLARAEQHLDALANATKKERAELTRWAAQQLVPLAARELPEFTHGHTSGTSVVLQVGAIALALRERWFDGAELPEIWADYVDASTVRVGFDGPESVAWCIEGAARGMATLFSEWADVKRPAPPPTFPDRRIVEIVLRSERRTPGKETKRAPEAAKAPLEGVERRRRFW
jgi:hypothetical protein